MSFTRSVPDTSTPGATKNTGVVIFEDYLSTSIGWGVGSHSGGSILQSGSSVSNKAVGVIALYTGTTATGRAGLTSHVDGIWFGVNRWRFETRVGVEALSTSVQDFTIRFGFMDSVAADPTDGHFFRYTHGTNSGNWQCVTRNNGVETASNTQFAPSALSSGEPYSVFSIDVNELGNRISFSIDNRIVASHISGPTGSSRATGVAYSIIKKAGTTPRSLYLDWTYIVCRLGIDR